MEQNNIRPFNNQQYTIDEGASIIEELDKRTRYGNQQYNSIQVLGEKMRLVEEQASAAISGYRGTIVIADTPTEDGIYTPTEAGTYTNAGGLVYAPDTTDKGFDVKFIKTGSSWMKNTVANVFTQEFEDVFTDSYNLIGKRHLTGLYWNTSGTATFNANLVCTQKIAILPSENYVLKGINPINAALPRVVFFNSSGVFISGENIMGGAQTGISFTSPENAYFAGFNLANVVGGGNDPQNSEVASTVMLAQSDDLDLPYLPYGKRITSDKINGLDDKLSEVAINKESLDAILEDYEVFSKFNGNDSKIDFSTIYTIDSDGDYIEFRARTGNGWVDFNDSLGMFGIFGSQNTLGIYNATTIYLRQHTGSYLVFDGLTDMVGIWHKVRIEVNGTDWDLYLDDVLKKTIPKTDSFKINTVGNAYTGSSSFALFDLEYLNFKAGGVITEIPDPKAHAGAVNLIKEYQKKEIDNRYSDCYVTYEPTGYLGRKSFTIYARRGNTNIYIGYKVQHEYDMSELVYSDLFRLRKADEYVFDGETMSANGNAVLISGENEFVYQELVGKSDFTGGYHGDEIYSDFQFFIDGVKVDLAEGFELLACQEAHYIQKSETHEAPDNVGGTPTPVVGHPVDATHLKITTFTKEGYETKNDIIWQRTFNLFWYHGISCIGKIQALEVYDENLDFQEMTGSNNNYLETQGNREMRMFNDANSKSALVTATLFNGISDDSECTNFIWDRANDSKYYRKTPNYTAVIGHRETSVMKVKFL